LKALFSLDQLNSVTSLAKRLINLGWQIVATDNVSKHLNDSNIENIVIGQYVGIQETYPFPPTMHPKVESALTTDQDDKIDLVYNITYPQKVGNDVGGHTLLGLAAKGSRIVVFTQGDMEAVIQQLEKNHNEIDPSLRQQLIDKANLKISHHFSNLLVAPHSQPPARVVSLKEGENPYQSPADFYITDQKDQLSLGQFEQVSGEEPCFTNLADFDSILKILCLITEAFKENFNRVPYIMIAAKHGNPCGLAVSWETPEEVVNASLFCNPRAVWGGEVITNFPIKVEISEQLIRSTQRNDLFGSSQWMLDLVVAPEFEDSAIDILGKRKQRKIFKNPMILESPKSSTQYNLRPVRGGHLSQPPNNYILNLQDWTDRSMAIGQSILDSLIVAWAVAWNSNHGGNEVALAKNGALVGVGGGPSTIEACQTAIHRSKQCGHNLENAVFAADAFFPFTDSPQELVEAGCSFGLVPKGGKKFIQVQQFFKDHKLEIFYLPEQYRGFCRH